MDGKKNMIPVIVMLMGLATVIGVHFSDVVPSDNNKIETIKQNPTPTKQSIKKPKITECPAKGSLYSEFVGTWKVANISTMDFQSIPQCDNQKKCSFQLTESGTHIIHVEAPGPGGESHDFNITVSPEDLQSWYFEPYGRYTDETGKTFDLKTVFLEEEVVLKGLPFTKMTIFKERLSGKSDEGYVNGTISDDLSTITYQVITLEGKKLPKKTFTKRR